MSKSIPEFPSFSGGTVSLNGQVKARTSKNGDVVNSNYDLSEFENQALKFVQETIADKLPELNVFSADVLKNINSQVDAYKNNAMDSINQIYEPILKNLKNDIASRFGSFSNSSFMNQLNNIVTKRSDAISALAQDLAAQRSTLENNELTKRYNYLNFLNNYQNNLFNNILNSIEASQNNSSMGNSYNIAAYNNAYDQYLNNQKLQQSKSNVNNYISQLALSSLLSSIL